MPGSAGKCGLDQGVRGDRPHPCPCGSAGSHDLRPSIVGSRNLGGICSTRAGSTLRIGSSQSTFGERVGVRLAWRLRLSDHGSFPTDRVDCT
jgi:hypothetical protein